MKRPQYVFRPNLKDPQHRRAWALLQQVPSAKRKEFLVQSCLLYTSDAADDMQCVDLGGRRIIKTLESPPIVNSGNRAQSLV